MAPLGFLLFFSACAVDAPVEPRFRFDPGRFSPAARRRVARILREAVAVTELEARDVESSPVIYDFLMSHLPFASDCARALGKGEFRVVRQGDTMRVEHKGMRMTIVEMVRDGPRWIFLTEGVYETVLLGDLRGEVLIIIRADPVPERGTLRTEGRVLLRVAGKADFLQKVAPRAVRYLMREQAALFVEASQGVAEMAWKHPEEFYKALRAAPGVDRTVLENFRRAVVK